VVLEVFGMPMSQEHKDALARGRRESRAVKRYLEAISVARKPGRPVTPDSLRKRIAALEEKIAGEADALRVLGLRQDRMDAEQALVEAEGAADMAQVEADFVEYARAYAQRKGIGYAAWRESGVPADVLGKAGIARGFKG
jgi:hypothetical protein